MAESTLLASRLVSHYETYRDAKGDLVVMMPWPARPLLGCAARAAIVATGAWFFGVYGLSTMAVLFAVIVIAILIFQSSHAWILCRGLIKPARTFAGRLWPGPDWSGAVAVVLRRDLWPGNGGSTDTVLVVTDASSSHLKIAGVYNWDGSESRLASGGSGSLARSGPEVPSAPAPLFVGEDFNLKMSVSEAIREITDVLLVELRVPLVCEWGRARQRPDDVD